MVVIDEDKALSSSTDTHYSLFMKAIELSGRFFFFFYLSRKQENNSFIVLVVVAKTCTVVPCVCWNRKANHLRQGACPWLIGTNQID